MRERLTDARYARKDEDVQDAQLDTGADFENEQDPPPLLPPPEEFLLS